MNNDYLDHPAISEDMRRLRDSRDLWRAGFICLLIIVVVLVTLWPG